MRSDGNSISLSAAVKNQYIYKLHSYSGYFTALILAQIIAAILSMFGTVSYSTGNQYIVGVISAFFAVCFSLIWAVAAAFALTTNAKKNISFEVVGNRFSDCLSDIAFILTGCVFGGVTTAILSAALRTPVYFIHIGSVLADGYIPNFAELCIVAAATALYMLLFASAGYLAGVLVRLHSIFIVLIPALLIGLIIYGTRANISHPVLSFCYNAIFEEEILGFFALKVVSIAAVLFALGAVISNRLEVRR